jgi:hypothetical protein
MPKHTGKLARCGIVLGLLLAAGCHGTQQQRLPENSGDPLFGPDAPSLPPKGGPAAPQGPSAKLNNPLPLTQQTSSTAEMAGGPLKGARQTIAIPVNEVNGGKKAWQENDGGKATLNPPQPIVQGLKPVLLAPNEIPPELKEQLDRRNMVFHRLQAVEGGVKFVCIVADPRNADSLRNYEVVAADITTAVREVLARIDQAR